MLSVFFNCVCCGLVLVLCRFWQSSLLLRVGLCDKFSGANFCFLLSFCVLVFLIGICLCSSRIFLQTRPGRALKNSLHVRSCFLSCSLCLRVWVDDVFCFSSFPFCFSEERQLRSNRTPHTPPHVLLFLSFSFSVPAALVCSPVLAVRPFCSGVSSGCHSGPRAFFGFSRDFSEAFFLGREAAKAFARFFLWSCCFSRFAASHVSSGPCAWSQEGRPAGGLARSPCASEGKGSIALLGRRDPDPLLFVFFCVASVCFGSQGPKSLFVCGGTCCFPPRLSHARFVFPSGLFVLSLYLSFAACHDVGRDLCCHGKRMPSMESGIPSVAPRMSWNNRMLRDRRPPQPPPLVCSYMCVGGTLSFFLRWLFLEIPPKSIARRGVGRKILFFLGFLVISWLGSRCFCYCFALIYLRFCRSFPGKLVFLPTLSFWGGFRDRALEDFG